MHWTISYSDQAAKALQKIDRQDRELIMTYMRERIGGQVNPRAFGSALSANLAGYWRYRIGKYRILCELADEVVTVYVLKVEHRRSVYLK